jgi:glycosyltransferase involved in cell wall biosynthesis
MTGVPPLSVVMPARNVEPFVDAAVESILRQTYADFEFVALDDGSTDGTAARLEAWAARDARLRVVRSPRPLGLVGSSNAAVRASRAPLVARMDADDISHPDRLRRQMALIAERPDAVLVGTLFEGIDAAGRRVRPRDRWRLLRRSPFAPFPHGSILFRREAFDAAGGYLEGSEFWEDLNLYRRLAERGRVLVIPEALYQYRFHATSVRSAERQDALVRGIVGMWQSVAASRRGRRGDARRALITADDPRIQYLIAATRLWAGEDPRLLQQLSLRALASANPVTAAIVLVAAAAAVSPRATRRLLSSVIAIRDRLSGLLVGGTPREWRFV